MAEHSVYVEIKRKIERGRRERKRDGRAISKEGERIIQRLESKINM